MSLKSSESSVERNESSVADPKLFVSDPAPDPICGAGKFRFRNLIQPETCKNIIIDSINCMGISNPSSFIF